jgi:hypothetical protein
LSNDAVRRWAGQLGDAGPQRGQVGYDLLVVAEQIEYL